MSIDAMKLPQDLRALADRFSKGWHDGIKIDASDIMLLSTAAEAIEQAQKQEPVAYIHRNEYNEYRLEPHDNFDIKSIPSNVDVPLFKVPQRQPLTDEELKKTWYDMKNIMGWYSFQEIARAIEAAHGIKGEA